MSQALPPVILAADISKTRTGLAIGRVGSAPRFLSINGKDQTIAYAMRGLGRELIRLTDPGYPLRPDFICYEAQINLAAFMGKYDPEAGKVKMTSNPQTTIALAKMIGVFEYIFAMRSIEVVSYPVATVRKHFIGHGNLKGEEAKRRTFDMCELFQWRPRNRDESDAGAVWAYGAAQIEPKLAPLITPMMCRQVATTIAGVDIGMDVRELFQKGARVQRLIRNRDNE